MARYVLHTNNPDGPTADELTLIGRQGGTVLDQSRRALLVELNKATADQLAAQLPGWSVQPETVHPIPDLKKRVKK
jgi:hypothetical protein